MSTLTRFDHGYYELRREALAPEMALLEILKKRADTASGWSILNGAEYRLIYGPYLLAEMSKVAEWWATAEQETCWHCHTSREQTGKRGSDRCDLCGVMFSAKREIPIRG